MSKRKKVAVDAIVEEMGAVAAFARSGPALSNGGSHERNGQALLAGLLVVPTTAPALEQRTIVGGKYAVAVGWDAEPAIEGQKNAAGIRILRADTSPVEPVEGVEDTLIVRIRQGAETSEFPLRTVFGRHGYYVAHFVPTRAGDYEFTFVGAVEGNPIEELFDSATGRFGAVEPAADVQFPVCLGGPSQVAASVREARIAAENAWVLATLGLGIGFCSLVGLLTNWRTRSGERLPHAAVGAGASAEQDQPVRLADGGPTQTRAGEEGALASLREDFGRTLRQEITQALEPALMEFRQHIAQSVREQTDQALRPVGSRPR